MDDPGVLPLRALHEVWRLLAPCLTEAELYRLLLTERGHHILDANDVAVLHKNAGAESRGSPTTQQSPFLNPEFWKQRYALRYSTCPLTQSVLASSATAAAISPLERYALYKSLCQVAATAVCPVCHGTLAQWVQLLQRKTACGTRQEWEAVRCPGCDTALSARRSFTAWACYRRVASPVLGCLSGLPSSVVGGFEGLRPIYHSSEDGCSFARMQLRMRHPFEDLRNAMRSPKAVTALAEPASPGLDFPIFLCFGYGRGATSGAAVGVYLSSALLLLVRSPRRQGGSAAGALPAVTEDRFEVRLYSLAQKLLGLRDKGGSRTEGGGASEELGREQQRPWYWTAEVPMKGPHSDGASDICAWDSRRGFWFGHSESENAALFVDATSAYAVSNPSIPFRLRTSLFLDPGGLFVETNHTENAAPIRFLEIWAPYWAESPSQFHPCAVALHARRAEQTAVSAQSPETLSSSLAALFQGPLETSRRDTMEAARDGCCTEASVDQAEEALLPTSEGPPNRTFYAHHLGEAFPSPVFRGEEESKDEFYGDASSGLRSIRAQNRQKDAAFTRELFF